MRRLILSSSVGHITAGIIILEAASVGHITAGVIIFETAEFIILDVLLELPLELAYDVCLVSHVMDLLCVGNFGHTFLHC